MCAPHITPAGAGKDADAGEEEVRRLRAVMLCVGKPLLTTLLKLGSRSSERGPINTFVWDFTSPVFQI